MSSSGTKEFELTIVQCVDLLGKCREARALVLSDSESFDAACRSLEYVGQVVHEAVGNGLGAYEKGIIWLALSSGHPEDEIARLFRVIREARNKAVHDGAWARHLSSRLIDLLLIIEEALVKDLTEVRDLMVRNPVVAKHWHLLSHVRKTMLENSFSYLPAAKENGEWVLISDHELMRLIRRRGGGTKPISQMVSSALGRGDLNSQEPEMCVQGELIRDVFERVDSRPMLVFGGPDDKHLVGILTAFDLL